MDVVGVAIKSLQEGGGAPWVCASGPPGSGVNWVGVHVDGVTALLGFRVVAPALLLLAPPMCDHTTAQVCFFVCLFAQLVP